MRAYVVDGPGARFRGADVPRPIPATGEVLIRVRASGLNPLDTKIRLGKADHAKHPLPAVLGLDMSGVVEEVGPGVASFQPGDEVYGMVGGVGGTPGTLRSSSQPTLPW
jgi:NADPH:quinone reductase